MFNPSAITIQIVRGAQSVLHAHYSREEAYQIGQQIGNAVVKNFNEATARYGTDDPIFVGEAAAHEWLTLKN